MLCRSPTCSLPNVDVIWLLECWKILIVYNKNLWLCVTKRQASSTRWFVYNFGQFAKVSLKKNLKAPWLKNKKKKTVTLLIKNEHEVTFKVASPVYKKKKKLMAGPPIPASPTLQPLLLDSDFHVKNHSNSVCISLFHVSVHRFVFFF